MFISQVLMQLLGFSLLALSLNRHYQQVAGRTKRLSKIKIKWFRIAGYGILCVSAAIIIVLKGFAVGMTYWLALATLDALCIALILTYRAKWLRYFVKIK